MHKCVPYFEISINEALKNGDFDGINVRFSRNIQDPDTKRWFLVPVHSKKADISIQDGVQFG